MKPFAAGTKALQDVWFGKVVLVGFVPVSGRVTHSGWTEAGMTGQGGSTVEPVGGTWCTHIRE